MSAYLISSAARGREHRVFDWKKAAKYIQENNVTDCEAGLSGDLEYTCGRILENGNPVPETETYCYLSSNWAEPVLVIDGCEIPCWSWKHEVPGYDSGTYWPEDALKILNSEN